MAKLLIVQQDLLPEMTEVIFASTGYEVCGIARNFEEGLALATRHQPDLLLLDVQLDDGFIRDLVVGLTREEKRVGVLYVTDNLSESLLNGLDGDAYLRKPYVRQDLIRALKLVEQMVYIEKAILDSPRGFHVLTSGETAVAFDFALGKKDDLAPDRGRLVSAQSKLLLQRVDLGQDLRYETRNNIQLVSRLLNEAIETTNENAEAAGIGAIARRVMTLANAYDHLLDSRLTRTTDFGGYLISLCDSFRDFAIGEHQGVVLICQSELLMLDLDSSTALGLVVAELIANSYLHAFPKEKGTIKISLSQSQEHDSALITVTDDGVGILPQTVRKRHGLGLVNRLMQQVDGSASVLSDHGTAWTLEFPVPLF